MASNFNLGRWRPTETVSRSAPDDGFDETDITVRASIPGLTPVEWVLQVRRVQAGTLEVDTRYQPGSQAQGNSLFDAVSVLLLEDDGESAACEGFRNAPGTLRSMPLERRLLTL